MMMKLRLASVAGLVLQSTAAHTPATHASLSPQVLEALPLGSIAPQGWLLDQLLRQASSLSGHLAVTRGLGGYHGDSDVVNQSRWLGGPGGGPWFISDNDQWFPYWANGNVPLASLLRASNALDRLPSGLALGELVDGYMEYVLAHDLKDGWIQHDKWTPTTSLDEGGFEMVQALTQWSEDRPVTDRKAVAKAVLAHLLHEAGVISPATDVSWTATRWPTFVTLVGYAVDRLLPEFGSDVGVTPLGAEQTEAVLVTAAHDIGKYGMDWHRYYRQQPPTERTGNRSFPRSASPDWNVYDHGVNNAEGAMRWPSALYRLNHSLAEGKDAMDFLLHQLDTHQGQITSSFCADEVFCGRNPNRGTETCTVVEQMASLEHAFATFGSPGLFDRVERLAFNALPAALTGDMWAHVYVQQANSVFAGVSHPKAAGHPEHASSAPYGGGADGGQHGHHHDHHHHEHTIKRACERSACSEKGPAARAGEEGGPAPFSEIETTNYFGVSHFPCCITNFPQGWPKFAASTVFFEKGLLAQQQQQQEEEEGGAIVLASLVPLTARVAAAGNATVSVAGRYPFADTANVSVTAGNTAIVLKLRIPGWATNCTVNGVRVVNGSYHAVPIPARRTVRLFVELRPEIILEFGWGATNATLGRNDSIATTTRIAAGDLGTRNAERSTSAATTTAAAGWLCKSGGLSGGDMHVANSSVEAAMSWCGGNSKCAGFTAATHVGACGDTGLGVLEFHFKDAWGAKRPTADENASYWLPAGPAPSPDSQRPTNALGVSRGPLVFVLHPRENKTVVRNFTAAIPPRPHALDYEIKTAQPWNYAIVAPPAAVSGAGSAQQQYYAPRFNTTAGGEWSPHFAFDDRYGSHPFSIQLTGRRLPSWGFWRGSNITDIPPSSPVLCHGDDGAMGREAEGGAVGCGEEERLTLVPFGSSNIRISVFPWTRP